MRHQSRGFLALSSWLWKYELLDSLISLFVKRQWRRQHCLSSASPDRFHFLSNRRLSFFACDASGENHLVMFLDGRLLQLRIGARWSKVIDTAVLICSAKSFALFAGAVNSSESISISLNVNGSTALMLRKTRRTGWRLQEVVILHSMSL